MPGQKPDLRINIRDQDGQLKELFAAWSQEKGHFAGKIKVTEEVADLFKPGNEIHAFVFKNGDAPKPAEPKSRKRATEKPQPRPAA